MAEEVVLSRTESVCPECLATVPAERIMRGGRRLPEEDMPEARIV